MNRKAKKTLPKNFFKDNPLDELSAARFAYVSMTALWNDEFRDKISEVLDERMEPARKKQIEAEKTQISQLESGDEAVTFIRKGYDIINREILCKKILTMQAEVMPPLLRRLQTSFQDGFVETAVYILAHAEQAYVDQLMDLYPKIRSPYAQSMACLVFGVQRREDTLALLLTEYERLKKEYLAESFCQGPLLAIYILYDEA